LSHAGVDGTSTRPAGPTQERGTTDPSCEGSATW